jgi:hypothetical protein
MRRCSRASSRLAWRRATAAKCLARDHRADRRSAAREVLHGRGVRIGTPDSDPSRRTDAILATAGQVHAAGCRVACLRHRGVPALLSAGDDQDVSADLPGLGMFNHAIVFVPGVNAGKDLWIDATAEYARVGTLPAQAAIASRSSSVRHTRAHADAAHARPTIARWKRANSSSLNMARRASSRPPRPTAPSRRIPRLVRGRG